MEGILLGSMTLLLLFSCKSCLTPCDPMFYSAQGFPVLNTFQSFVKLMSIEAVMPSNFPSIRVFSNESVLRIGRQSITVLAPASVLPMNIWTDFL